MEEFLIPIVMFGATVMCFKIITDYKLRKKIIDSGLVNEKLDGLFQKEVISLASLKWGLVLLGMGAAFVVGTLFIPAEIRDKITIGLILGFGGIGFLIYFGIASAIEKNKKK